MNNSYKVALRSIGSLPLSIGTSLAIEVFSERVDSETNKTVKAVTAPDYLWINLRTIVRNLHGAIEDKIFRNQLRPGDFIEVAAQECEFIVNHLNDASRERTKVVFYYSDPFDIELIFPHANIKQRTPQGAVTAAAQYAGIEDITVALLQKHLLEVKGLDARKFGTLLKGESHEAFIITHCAIDLLAEKDFLKLTLLESHTGKLKKKTDWNTKLGKHPDLDKIPFNELTLQVFGDNSTFLSPMSQAFKKELVASAVKYSWTPLTTREKIRYGLSNIADPTVKKILREMLL